MYLRKNKREGNKKENDLEYRKYATNSRFDEQKSQMTVSAAGLEISLSKLEQASDGD